MPFSNNVGCSFEIFSSRGRVLICCLQQICALFSFPISPTSCDYGLTYMAAKGARGESLRIKQVLSESDDFDSCRASYIISTKSTQIKLISSYPLSERDISEKGAGKNS